VRQLVVALASAGSTRLPALRNRRGDCHAALERRLVAASAVVIERGGSIARN